MAKNYTKNRWAHLARYAVERGLRCCGLYRGRAYCHILFTENKEQKKEVIKKNLLKGVKADMLSNTHTDAHHLNSSQILCYNFFRPLIDKNSGATQKLVDCLLEQGISIEKGAKCAFEYTDDRDKMEKKRDKPTEFDFHIIGSDVEVFFEIKYTENSFGSAEKNDNHKEKYELIYKPLLKNAPCLNHTPGFEEFAKFYQLYRNAVRITNKKKYLVLLYPEENESVEKQAKEFVENKVKPEYQENIKRVYWKKIVEENSELYKKYFAE